MVVRRNLGMVAVGYAVRLVLSVAVPVERHEVFKRIFNQMRCAVSGQAAMLSQESHRVSE